MEGFDSLDPISLNIEGVGDLVSSKINRTTKGYLSSEEGAKGPEKDSLDLPMSDEELKDLAMEWRNLAAPYEGIIKPRRRRNKAYYLGKQKAQQSPYSFDDTPIAGNLIFEAEETFLAAALSKNPDPVVYADGSKEGNELANDTKAMLSFHADTKQLRRMLSRMTRQWTFDHLGVLKHGWDDSIKDITTENRRIQDFILDPGGFVDVYGDFTSWLGEQITVSAQDLCDLYPKHAEYIKLSVDGKMGTNCVYTEWWTDEYMFVTYVDVILEKRKNPHFNYSKGARNHFAKPKKPFTFLSVFSVGEEPYDITGVIEQNIPQQNLISKEIHQIDYNISRSNNSVAFSGNNFNDQTGKQALQAWIRGHGFIVPPGVPLAEAIAQFPATPLPQSFFENLERNQQTLRGIFGTSGITPLQQDENTTARGMVLNQSRDSSRIGGGIGDSIEQVAHNVFNYWVQMYHVYYTAKHFAPVIGIMKAVEYTTLSSSRFTVQVVVTVQPDSMKPKDEITAMNQATALWGENALGLKTFLRLQKLSDPQAALEDSLLWIMDKKAYFAFNAPELYQKYLQFQAQQGAPGGEQGAAAPSPETAAVPSALPPSLGGEPPNASLAQVPLPPDGQKNPQ